MSWPPVDSAEARELREAQADEQQQRRHDPSCSGGWLGEDLDGRLIPCLDCRPHLIRLHDGRIVHRSTAHRLDPPHT